MKILFYLEPHPIRNEFFHYQAVLLSKWGKKILAWSQPDGGLGNTEIRVACHQLAYELVQKELPELTSFLIPTTKSEEKAIQANLRNWASDGLNLWVNLMEGTPKESLDVYLSYLSRIKREVFDFDVVIFWGQNNLVANAAKSMGATPFFMELATMRNPFPPSFYIDGLGINGLASLAQLDLSYIQEKCKLLPSCEEFLTKLDTNPLNTEQLLDQKFNFTTYHHTERLTSRNDVLVPLQIGDDANILIGSNYNSSFEFVQEVLDIFRGTNTDLVFKPHPGAFHRGGMVYDDHYRCKKLVESQPGAFWYEQEVPKKDYISFLRSFNGVVTINSSVGFEAMILGVPVFPLGQALYKPKGFEFDREHIPELLQSRHLVAAGKNIAAFALINCFLDEKQCASSFLPLSQKIQTFLSHPSSLEDYYNSLTELHTNKESWWHV